MATNEICAFDLGVETVTSLGVTTFCCDRAGGNATGALETAGSNLSVTDLKSAATSGYLTVNSLLKSRRNL